jgi:acetylglutamate kinase
MQQQNREPVFVRGQRVTDRETLDITARVMIGDINRTFVGQLCAAGTKAVGLHGADNRTIQCEALDQELGFVGSITHVRAELIEELLALHYTPVIAGMGCDASGQLYNINADSAAAKIALALQASKLVVLTNVSGLYESFGEENSLISEIDAHGLIRLMSTNKLSAGMIPKVEAILAAISGGVTCAHILDGRVLHALLLEIFTPEGIGTMVRADGSLGSK